MENLFEFGKSWITFPNGFTIMWSNYLLTQRNQFCKFPIKFLKIYNINVSSVNGNPGDYDCHADTPTLEGVQILSKNDCWANILIIGKTK